MPFKHGSKTSVYLDGADMSPYLNQADWSSDQESAETTTFNATWKTHIAGRNSAKAGFAGYYDPLQLQLETHLAAGVGSLVSGVLTVCQGGTVIGDDARLFSVTSSSYAESSPVGGVIAVKWDTETTTAVGTGWVLHPLGSDTDTTTGATRDDAAATATGYIGHLQVTAQNATSWVVVIQDASASNFSDGATVMTFTAATGKTSQRIVSATNTTALRRYVRYVATRTGGSAASTITFQLSYARNS